MREKLEKKIFDKPKDVKRFEDYADWLDENDDPRGKLIRLQIALENQSLNREKRFDLELAERKLIEQHGRKWIGEVGDFVLTRETEERPFNTKPGYAIWWTRGWVSGLQLDELTLKLSKVLLSAPEMKLFNKLVLTEPVNASCDYLHEWGLLDKIKFLDLSYGRISDKGALTLAGDKSLKSLDVVDVTGNQIGDEGYTAITKTFPKVLIADQTPIVSARGEQEAAK